MTTWSMSYHGYHVSGKADEKQVQYQAPEWPEDPRIVKAPSLDTAKRWICEETRRKVTHGLEAPRVYLVKSWLATDRKTYWRITDASCKDLVQSWFDNPPEARKFAEHRSWVLLEHFNY